VQQELSFTSMMYTLKPFVDWMRENSDATLQARGAPTDEALAAVITRTLPYINTVLRATESRAAPKAVQVSKTFGDFTSMLQDDIYSAGGRPQAQHVLVGYLCDASPLLTGRLEREVDSPTDICYSALQAFRTGFFRYNSDRKVAAFSLAQYALKLDDAGLEKMLDALPPPEPRRQVTVNANPGRWSTGLAPECRLRSKALPCESVPSWMPPDMAPPISEQQQQEYSDEEKPHLDHLFAVLHDVPASRLAHARYLVGWKNLTSSEGKRFISCHFGYRASPDSAHAHALVSVTFKVEDDEVRVSEPMYFAHTHFQMELGSKLFGLLNASYTVYQMPEPQREAATLAITVNNIRMLDDYVLMHCYPEGTFLDSMCRAAQSLLHYLNVAAELGVAELREAAKGATAGSSETLLWGGPDYEHHTIGAASADCG
jgi:hypothetical protein